MVKMIFKKNQKIGFLQLPLGSNQVFLFWQFAEVAFLSTKEVFLCGLFLVNWLFSFLWNFGLNIFLSFRFLLGDIVDCDLTFSLEPLFLLITYSNQFIYSLRSCILLYATLIGLKEGGRESSMNCIKYPPDTLISTSFGFVARIVIVKICSLSLIVPSYFRFVNWFIKDEPWALSVNTIFFFLHNQGDPLHYP